MGLVNMNFFLNFSDNFNHGWHNVTNAHGIQITLIGMFLCFFALAIIAIIIGLVPYLLRILNRYYPEQEVERTVNMGRKSAGSAGDDVIAAIGTALLYSMTTTEKE